MTTDANSSKLQHHPGVDCNCLMPHDDGDDDDDDDDDDVQNCDETGCGARATASPTKSTQSVTVVARWCSG